MNGFHAARGRRRRAPRHGARARLVLSLSVVLVCGLLPAVASANHSTLTITCTPSTIAPGAATNCDATLQGGWYNGSNPTGTVTWTASQPGTFAPSVCSLTVIGFEKTTCGTRFTSTDAATGTITITARYGGGGTGSGYSSQTTTRNITIETPVAVADSASLAEDAPAEPIDVLQNDTGSGLKQVVTVTQPARGTVGIAEAGTGVTYAPAADACTGAEGPDSFTYTLNGGSTATVSVTVTCVPDPPLASTGAASSTTVIGAVLNGTVNPQGSATTYRFEYGTTTAYGRSTPAADAGADKADHEATATVTGLLPLTTYHFRVVATNADGTVEGADQVFTTNPLAPGVATQAASGLERTAAVLNGSVDPNGVATSYRFEYGTSTDYGSTTLDRSASASTPSRPVSEQLTGLEPGTTYYYRLVATSAAGTTAGGEQTFTTSAVEVAAAADTLILPRVPVLSGLSAVRRCVRLTHRAASRGGGGLSFRFTLSTEATVKYVIKRRSRTAGRSACPAITGRTPGGSVAVSSQERTATAGGNRIRLARAPGARGSRTSAAGPTRVRLAQIVDARKLRPGTYILYATARDRFGQTSRTSRVKFWVLAPRP